MIVKRILVIVSLVGVFASVFSQGLRHKLNSLMECTETPAKYCTEVAVISLLSLVRTQYRLHLWTNNQSSSQAFIPSDWLSLRSY